MSSSRRVDVTQKSGSRPVHDRVSVFSRLGSKGGSANKNSSQGDRSSSSLICRQWSETGFCKFGSKCKLAASHSHSKRPEATGDQRPRKEGPSTTGKKSPTFELDWSNWDEKNLDSEDVCDLEMKRQLLERELAKQLAEDRKDPQVLSNQGPSIKKTKPAPLKSDLVPSNSAKRRSSPDSGGRRSSGSSSSSSTSTSSSDSSSSDSSSDTSSEPSKKKPNLSPKKVLKKPPSSDIKKKKFGEKKKPTASKSSSGVKKSSTKPLVSGSKLSRHSDSNDKKKKIKKVARTSTKRPLSPTPSKKIDKPAVSVKDDKAADPKLNPVRKGSERDKFGFYHATAPLPIESSKDTGSTSRGHWKDKRDQPPPRRSSLSPSRLPSDSAAKRSKKNIKPAMKRSQSNEKRGTSSSRPLARRSSHSPHGKRRTSPKGSGHSTSRSGSTGRDHRPQQSRDDHHRDVRRDDSIRGKYDRDRKPVSSRGHNPQGGGHRENWNRYQGQPSRDDRSRKSPGMSRDRIPSPAMRQSGQQSDSRKFKDSGNNKMRFSGGNAEPRSDYREKPHMNRISRERSPRERLLPPESIRHRNKDRNRSSRERIMSPEAKPRDYYAKREPGRYGDPGPTRDRERESERPINDYPKRASPFERLGGPFKRWEGPSHEDSADLRHRQNSGPIEKYDHCSPKRIDTQKKPLDQPNPGIEEETQRSQPTFSPSTVKVEADSSKTETSSPALKPSEPEIHNPTDCTEERDDFSDLEINDSDEEILNKINSNENEEEGQLQTSNEGIDDETEEGEVGGIDSRSSSRKSHLTDTNGKPSSKSDKQGNDLLEGISDEDLDVSEDDESKTKIADALGVDWSLLMKEKTSVPEQTQVTDIRKRWSVVSIFNRIGLSKKYLGDDYEKIVQDIKAQETEEDMLTLFHDNSGLHQRMKTLKEKRKKFFASNGPYVIPHKIDFHI